MELKENSLFPWLCKVTYGKGYLPKNLCVYFWASLFTIPFLPFSFPWIIYHLIFNRKNPSNGVSIVPKFSISISWYIGSLFVGAAQWGFVSLSTWLWGLWVILVGLLLACIAILSIAYFLFEVIPKCIPRRKPREKKKKPNILIEYIKAKKQKICPQITWLK